MKEAMRSFSSCRSALNGEIMLICIPISASGTIIGTLEHLNQRALANNYKYIQWKLCVLNIRAHKDNQVEDGEKTQLSGNRVVQFIFAKHNYLSIMRMWFPLSSTLCNKYLWFFGLAMKISCFILSWEDNTQLCTQQNASATTVTI